MKTHEIKFYDKTFRQIVWLPVVLQKGHEMEDLNAYVASFKRANYGYRSYRKLTPNNKYQPHEVVL